MIYYDVNVMKLKQVNSEVYERGFCQLSGCATNTLLYTGNYRGVVWKISIL
jgi:hypothetical protein